MSTNTENLIDVLQAKIDYFHKKYGLTYGEVIGALECIKLNLWDEACKENNEQEQ